MTGLKEENIHHLRKRFYLFCIDFFILYTKYTHITDMIDIVVFPAELWVYKCINQDKANGVLHCNNTYIMYKVCTYSFFVAPILSVHEYLNEIIFYFIVKNLTKHIYYIQSLRYICTIHFITGIEHCFVFVKHELHTH